MNEANPASLASENRMRPPTLLHLLTLLVVLAALSAACSRLSPTPASLTLDQLANAEFDSPAPAEGPIRLAEGIYQEAAAPGAASAFSVSLLQDLAAFGDLDSDGLSDAAVILAGSGGGSGTFITLAAVPNDDGAPGHAATTYLGDRVRVSSVVIDSGEIVVTLTEHAPTDPLCCPRLTTERRFRLEQGTLAEITGTP